MTLTGAGEDAAATGDLDITDDLTLTGVSRASTTIINAQGLGDRVIQTDPTGPDTITVTIQHLTVENGNSPQIASVNAEGRRHPQRRELRLRTVPTAGTLHLIDVTVDHNAAAARGGGRRNDGVMTIVDSVDQQQQHDQRQPRGRHHPGRRGLTLDQRHHDPTITTPTPAAALGGDLRRASSAPAINPVVTIDASTISGNMAQAGGGIFRNRGTINRPAIDRSAATPARRRAGPAAAEDLVTPTATWRRWCS